MIAMAYLMNRLKPKPRIFEQWGASLLLFLLVTPGFGIQYLYWVTPWVVALGARAAALLYITSGVFMFATYTYWSGGLPWWFADSLYKVWAHWFHVPHLLAWGSIGVLLVWFWWSFVGRRVLQTSTPHAEDESPRSAAAPFE
jgi:hypothetical protein